MPFTTVSNYQTVNVKYEPSGAWQYQSPDGAWHDLTDPFEDGFSEGPITVDFKITNNSGSPCPFEVKLKTGTGTVTPPETQPVPIGHGVTKTWILTATESDTTFSFGDPGDPTFKILWGRSPH